MKRAISATLSLLLAAAGCTAALEEVNPVGTDAGTTSHTHTGAGGGGTGGAPVDAGAPKRTVMHRNPFGNVAETHEDVVIQPKTWAPASAAVGRAPRRPVRRVRSPSTSRRGWNRCS